MRSTLVVKSAMLCIEAYRRYLSPHKGYICAYHAATGRSSCSRYGQRAIGRCGQSRNYFMALLWDVGLWQLTGD